MKNLIPKTLVFFLIILTNLSSFSQNRAKEITLAQHYLSVRPEVYLAVYPIKLNTIASFSKLVSIDKINGDTIFVYSNIKQFNELLKSGYSFEALTPPSMLYPAVMSGNGKSVTDWNVYPTYSDYVAMMQQFETDYPQLCKLINMGQSIEGRDILAVKISDKVYLKQEEPEFLYTSSMHGDELTGMMLCLRMIDYLLSNYGSDAYVNHLLDSMEIYINPLANPDGTYFGGDHTVGMATRFNVNGIDLNRNFPDPEDGLHPDGNPWQKENVVMMNFMIGHNFVLAANLHTGAEVVNYPWDTWPTLHADNNWYVNLSRRYADTVHKYMPPNLGNYLSSFNNGITNGYQWYTTDGNRQDYMNYYLNGRETTMELSLTKTPIASTMPSYWEANYRSMLDYMDFCLYGFRGKITAAVSQEPLVAKVEILNHDVDNSHVYSHPANGYYFRPIMPGTYSLRFSAPGYKDEIRDYQVLGTNEVHEINVEMEVQPEGIDEIGSNPMQVQVFPNPFQSEIHTSFSLKKQGKVSFVLYDSEGKVITTLFDQFFTPGHQTQIIATEHIETGTYFLLLIFEDSRYSIKVNKVE
ncbi:MAG: T9SS type A sorting domain-containing protein [Bacteroidales bacterium]|nr:T9SS type A sorting domain-containing protein [Bacteroidales bacterium]MCF8457434.1 T9SS type A sorting domain-containing protein [Bacteroidales bacterium]